MAGWQGVPSRRVIDRFDRLRALRRAQGTGGAQPFCRVAELVEVPRAEREGDAWAQPFDADTC